MSNLTEITTRRFLLRKFEQSDIENVYRGLSHPDIIKHYGVSFDTLEATQEQMDWFSDLEKNGTGVWWAICSKDNEVFYGGGGLNDVDKKNKKAEVGFWVLRDYWRQGIMTEVMPGIIEYAFEKMQLNKIEGFVETGNDNCKKALERLNFTHKECRENCEVKNGENLSLDLYIKQK